MVMLLWSINVLPQVRLPILTLESLLNCDYEIGEDVIIDLENGRFYFQYPESYASFEAWHHLHISCELNGDSLIDAIVVLNTRDGGTGRWQYVFPVLNNRGMPLPLKYFKLHDREDIKRIYKNKKYIYLDVLVHDEYDPKCCPNLKETWKLKFQGESFVKIE